MSSDFNGFWLQRLPIIVDETSLDKDAVTQMLKRLSTGTGKVVSNSKGTKQEEVDFIGKFVFCSNQEGKALKIEKGDPRWAVFKVPTFSEKGSKDDPLMTNKIVSEIPYFLDFLNSRKLHHNTCDSRMWFEPKVYHTKQLMLYYENSLSMTAQSIKQLIKDTWNEFPDEKEFSFSKDQLLKELSAYVKYIDKMKLATCLENEFKMMQPNRGRYTFFSLSEKQNDTQLNSLGIERNGSFYTFSV